MHQNHRKPTPFLSSAPLTVQLIFTASNPLKIQLTPLLSSKSPPYSSFWSRCLPQLTLSSFLPLHFLPLFQLSLEKTFPLRPFHSPVHPSLLQLPHGFPGSLTPFSLAQKNDRFFLKKILSSPSSLSPLPSWFFLKLSSLSQRPAPSH